MKFKNNKLTILAICSVMTIVISTTARINAEGMPKDSRTMVNIKTEWKDHLLHDMRSGLLPTVQKIMLAVSNNDMKGAADIARSRGMSHMQKMNMDMMAVLPKGMKGLGKSMHVSFDEVAKSADAGDSAQKVMGKLGNVLNSCNACHATYRLN